MTEPDAPALRYRSNVGFYDHLNTDPVEVPISMPELVRLVLSQNYGAHRFLSELVRQREAKQAELIAECRRRGDHDIAAYSEARRGSDSDEGHS